MNSLPCTSTLHSSLVASPEFARLRLVGYQQLPASATEPADLIELRQCPCCGSTLGREMGIGQRLERARAAHGGMGDQGMIGRCKRALGGDEGAVVAYVEAVRFEQQMGGAW